MAVWRTFHCGISEQWNFRAMRAIMLLQTLLHWPNIYFVRALAVHQFSVLKGISVHSATCAVKYTHPGWHSHRPEMRVQHNKEQKSRVNPASSNGNAHDDGDGSGAGVPYSHFSADLRVCSWPGLLRSTAWVFKLEILNIFLLKHEIWIADADCAAQTPMGKENKTWNQIPWQRSKPLPLLGNILDTQQMFSFVNRFLEIVSGRDLHNTRGERRAFHALLRTESIQVLAVFKSHVYECFAYPESVLHIPSQRMLPLSLSLIIHW